jgi:hypothetical protein
MQKKFLRFATGVICSAAVLVGARAYAAPIAFSQFGPAPAPGVQTSGGWDGGYINLTQEVNSQNNQAAFPQVVTGPYDQLKIDFDFRFSPGQNSGADGIGFAYVDSTAYGTSGPVASFSEEPNLANAFGVGFDTFNNTDLGDGGENTVSLHYNGAVVTSVPIDGGPLGSFENNKVHHASITVIPAPGGSNVNVSVTRLEDNVTVNPINMFVAGLSQFDGRGAFNARTGGANAVQDIDNVQFTHIAGGNDPTTTVLYTFVPEPTSLTLVGLGIGALALARRRR